MVRDSIKSFSKISVYDIDLSTRIYDTGHFCSAEVRCSRK